MHNQSFARRRHTGRLRNVGRQALALAVALLLGVGAVWAQDYPNGLAVSSINPERDSLAIARVRARLDSVRRAEHRPVVALSLCGGGAKGAAEVGALQYIVNELHIPIDFIAGTSIGGMLGGVMAMGYDVDDLKDLFINQNWDVLLSDKTDSKYARFSRKEYKAKFQLRFPFHLSRDERARRDAEGEQYDSKLHLGAKPKEPASFLNSLPSGYVYGFNIGNLLSSLSVGYQDSLDFCSLPIPFMCTSSDLVSCRANNFSSGDIRQAMRATMSIPAMFAPVKTDGMVLADGGLQNNLPTDLAVAVGADYVIAIDISNQEADYNDIDNVGDVLSQLIEISGREAYTRNTRLGDTYIRVDMSGYSSISFNRTAVDTLMARGYAAALADSTKLKYIAGVCRGQAWQDCQPATAPKRPATDIRKQKVLIGSVEFRGMSQRESADMARTMKLHPGDSVSAQLLEKVTSVLQATGNFEQVRYSLLGSSEPYDLVFDCRQGPVHQLGIGMRLDTQEWVAIALNLGLNTNKLMGSKYGISARIGSSRQNLNLHYYYDTPKAPTINVDANINQCLTDILMGFKDGKLTSDVFGSTELTDCRARYWSTGARVYLSNINWKKVDFNLGVQTNFYQAGPSDLYRALQEIDKYTLTQAGLAGAFANVRCRTLDEIYFPSRGLNFHLGYEGDFCRFGYSDFKPVHAFTLDLAGVIPLGSHVAIIPDFHHRSLLDDNPRTFFAHRNFVGGLLPGRFIDQQIPYVGCAQTFITTNHVSVLNLDIRVKVLRNFYASAFGGFLNSTDKLPDYFSSAANWDYSVGVGAAYNSIAGPIKGSVFWSKFFGWGACLSAGFDF